MWRDLADGAKFLIVGIVVLFIGGAIALSWITVFGPAFKEQQRRQFEESQQHKDAVVQDFADRCSEIATAKDEETKKTIRIVIAQRATNENINDLRMAPSVRECVENALREYTGGTK